MLTIEGERALVILSRELSGSEGGAGARAMYDRGEGEGGLR